jgi:hypothetical protein
MQRRLLSTLVAIVAFGLLGPATVAQNLQVSGGVWNDAHVASPGFVVLYTQGGANANGSAAQQFPDFNNSVLESADDFTVPAPGWIIDRVDAPGAWSQTSTPTFTDVRVIIYENTAGNLPGAVVTERSGAQTTETGAPNFEIMLNPAITLMPGTYWLSVVVVKPFGGGSGQWFWGNTDTVFGTTYAFRDPDNLIPSIPCPTWNYVTVCSPGGTGRSMRFTLHGMLVPVELVSFDATATGRNVQLSWATASETNNAGFEVQMRRGSDWSTLAFVQGHGTTTEAKTYSHTVADLTPGTHTFRLRQVDYDGAFEYSHEVEATVELAGSHLLSEAYPNPFNPSTSFSLAIARTQNVAVEVYNMLGQKVATLHNGRLEASENHRFTFEAGTLPSGMYLVKATGEHFAASTKVTLLK